MQEAKTWYVYLLCDPDTEIPFYVGKGTNKRIDRHEGTPENKAKHEAIHQIKARGKEVLKKKVAEFSDERAAYIYEWALINLYHEHLTNIKDNGHYTLAKVPKSEPEQEIIKPLLSLKQVAQRLKVSQQTIMHRLYESKLKGFQVGNRWRFTEDDVEAYVQRQKELA